MWKAKSNTYYSYVRRFCLNWFVIANIFNRKDGYLSLRILSLTNLKCGGKISPHLVMGKLHTSTIHILVRSLSLCNSSKEIFLFPSPTLAVVRRWVMDQSCMHHWFDEISHWTIFCMLFSLYQKMFIDILLAVSWITDQDILNIRYIHCKTHGKFLLMFIPICT